MNMYKPEKPIYIISKGRYNRRPTANMLEEMKQKYFIVVEEQEFELYKNKINSAYGTVLILPKKYLDNYDTFWEREKDNKTGPGAARNFCWEHSISLGFDWHWVLDDNIEAVERFNNNMKIKCLTSTPFYVIEQFCNRYENVVQSGMGYSIFCPCVERRPAIRFNTRLYSCQYIKNDLPFRWRGRYNEDTDLSLRILKAGYCTAEFNCFLIGKRATQTMSGGNTEEFYKNEGTFNKSKILVEMHPDVCTLTMKFNRDHHHVNYKVFKKNKLLFKDNYVKKHGVNNFGMILINKKTGGVE
jgi:hypothetical protein